MLFSILIPAYKIQFLRECIKSVLCQTLQDFEIIILNDCSPNDIKAITDSFNDARIKYYSNSNNVGAIEVVNNWNKCLDLSQGKYIICMGDDDMLMPCCLEEYKKAIDVNPGIDVFHCRSYIINEKSERVSFTTSWPIFESVYENMWHRIHRYREQFVGDFLYKSDSLKRKGGFFYLPYAWASDDITSYRVMDECGVIHINEPLFCYRKSGLTITSSGDPIVKLKAISLEEEWYKVFIENHKPQTEIEKVAYESIIKEMSHYFKTDRINTIAYCNKTHDHLIKSFFYWIMRHKKANLSIAEIIYAFIMALKNKVYRG